MDLLPTDVLPIIYSYIPISVKKNLNKQLFEEYCSDMKMIWKNFDSTIRYIIRNDYDYLLDIQFKNRYTHWKKLRRWRYKHIIYPHYVEYLRQFALEQKSLKCCKVIIKYNGDSSKKKYKRIRIKNIRWSN